MPTGTIDSAIFKDIFGTAAMRQVWSDGNRIQKYLDFEAGLARAQAKLKIIPQEACDEILKHVTVDQYDFEKLSGELKKFKDAQAAVMEVAEFKGNVALVKTDAFWDKDAEAVRVEPETPPRTVEPEGAPAPEATPAPSAPSTSGADGGAGDGETENSGGGAPSALPARTAQQEAC